MPRVIAGEKKGMPLVAPKGDLTRPTSDKVKESLFSILQFQLQGAEFLDLYAGSGQMAIEALSRGAESAVLVDQNRQSQKMILENLQKTGLSQRAILLSREMKSALRLLAEQNRQFDIIFLDPPYDQGKKAITTVLSLISDNKLLKKGGFVIAEHKSDDEMAQNVMNLTLYRRCKYGSTMLTFYTVDT